MTVVVLTLTYHVETVDKHLTAKRLVNLAGLQVLDLFAGKGGRGHVV